MSRIYITFLSILFIMSLYSCREKIDLSDPDDNGVTLENLLRGSEQKLLDNGLRLILNRKGMIYQPYPSGSSFGWDGQLYSSGMWMSGYQGGEIKSNIVGMGLNNKSNFRTVEENPSGDVYYVVEEMINNPINSFYSTFPRDENGNPKLFGNEMCWVYLQSDQNVPSQHLQNPFDSLFVSEALFSTQDFPDAVFIRYEIINRSAYNLNDVFLGFYTDVDLNFGSTNGDCIGYDSVWQISYTYSKSPAPGHNYYLALGNVILRADEDYGSELELYSHRYITRDDSTNYGEFALNSTSAYWALQGLDNNGEQMLHPTTGEYTRFALSGDPINRSGWFDNERDARSLISVGPLNFHVGEHKVFITAMYLQTGITLESAIRNIKVRASNIILQPDSWNY